MPCWVVPSVASEIWHVPVDQILAAIKSGKLAHKAENGFTFVDVDPHAALPAAPPPRARVKPISYKVVRSRENDQPLQLPRPAEVITPAEQEELAAAEATPTSAMGDWRRGRRGATARRTPPMQIAS